MIESYLTPRSVDATTAARVLAFLNSASDAESIARAVEILGEPDVGGAIGQRIIDRREEIGEFTDLQQILDIPYIGPERFTEIVSTLGGLVDWSNGSLVDPGSLRDEVLSLRRTVQILIENLDGLMISIRLEADRASPLLGQPVRLVARVTGSGDNRPRPGVPVTFIAPSASVEVAGGTVRRTGISATVLTGPSGTARVTVYAATDEPILAEQKSALIGLLAGFPADVGSPSEATDALDQLISDYSWDVNADFRRAVDLLYVRYGRSLIEGVNKLDHLSQWPVVETPVTAVAGDVAEETGGTQVRCGAVYTIRYRNWLGPWLQRFHARSTRSERLDRRIRAAAGSENAAVLIMNHTADYVRSRKGLVGALIGQTEARRTLNTFVAEGLPGAKAEIRTGLTAVLQGTDATLRSGGGEAVAGAAGLQVQLSDEIQRAPLSTELDSRLGTIESTLDGKAGQADVDAALGSKVDESAFAAYRVSVDGQFEETVKQAEFSEYQAVVDQRFEAKVDQSAFTAYQSTVDGRFEKTVSQDELSRHRTAVDREMSTKVDESAFSAYRGTVDTQLQGKVDQNELTEYQSAVKNQLDGKVDHTAFTDFQKTVDTRLRERPTLDRVDSGTDELIRRIERLERRRP